MSGMVASMKWSSPSTCFHGVKAEAGDGLDRLVGDGLDQLAAPGMAIPIMGSSPGTHGHFIMLTRSSCHWCMAIGVIHSSFLFVSCMVSLCISSFVCPFVCSFDVCPFTLSFICSFIQ